MTDREATVRIDPTTFDPGWLAELADPYPLLRALQEHGAVVVTKTSLGCVVGYDAADTILRDRRFLSAPLGQRYRSLLPPGAARDELAHRINFLDPPDHPRVRGIIAKVFTPTRVRALQPWAEGLAETLLDRAPLDDGTVDLRAGLAHPLPSLVISELLGVPSSDRDTLTEWTEAVTPLLGVTIADDERDRALAASESFAAYVRELLEDRRRAPTDDLLTALVNAHDNNERLSEPELLSLVVTLYSAGHRTTRDLFCNGLHALLGAADQYDVLARGDANVATAVQEFLRFSTPTLFVARVPMEPVELGGVQLRAWSPVLIFLATANRDPARFADPDRFDVRRAEAAPLSFAVGPHVCLGASLARLEAEVMLSAVVQRWPSLRLAEPAPAWWNSGPFRGLTHLRVQVA